jgi:hypothetical protein
MKLTDEFMSAIKNSLFDTYNIKCEISLNSFTSQDVFLRLEGTINERVFVGTMTILKSYSIENKFSFFIDGRFVGELHDDFIKHISSTNPLFVAMHEVNQFVIEQFSRKIPFVYKSFYIGVGEFFYINNQIEQLKIDMTPEFYLNLSIGIKLHDKDSNLDGKTDLLFVSYSTKNNLKQIQYQLPACLTMKKLNEHDDLDEFKKTLLREYMSRYSRITKNRLLLPIENFDILSYGVILDHLKIQSMNDIV